MEFALYRYEFEVMEKKDSSTNLFPDQWDNLTPREAFEKKSELLDELLEKDYKKLSIEPNNPNAESCNFYAPPSMLTELAMFTAKCNRAKTSLQFNNGRSYPLFHQYETAPKDGFTIMEFTHISNMNSYSHLFQRNTLKEEDNKSLHVIIDNRDTHQHVAIEVKPSVLKTDAMADSLARTLCKAFAQYGLLVKVVPIRDDKYFWEIVGDKKRYSKGFKKLLVEFPQINDPEVSKGLSELGIGYHRQHFGTGLGLLHKSPKGENIPFNENDAYQRAFMNLACLYGDIIKLTPMSGPSISLGGECAKTGEIPDIIMQNIKESQQSRDLSDMNARSQVMEYMNNYTQNDDNRQHMLKAAT